MSNQLDLIMQFFEMGSDPINVNRWTIFLSSDVNKFLSNKDPLNSDRDSDPIRSMSDCL